MKIHPPSARQRGSIILAVFWIMAVMGMALVASMRVVSYQTDVVNSQLDGLEALQYAERGVAVATHRSTKPWSTLLKQNFEDGGYEARIESEGGRFDINYILTKPVPEEGTVDKLLLRQIFAEFGMDEQDQAAVADALKDWVDPGDGEENRGAERQTYEEMGQPNFPFNRPFFSLEEMRLVKGMDIVESYNPNWRDWFTTFSVAGLNLADAEPRLVAVALQTDLESLQKLEEEIAGADGIRETEDDVRTVGAQFAIENLSPDVTENYVLHRVTSPQNGTNLVERIESTGFVGDIRRRIILIIQGRNNSPRILDRREEFIQ